MSQQEPPVAVTAQPDCGHKEWTLGCQRCFDETTALAKGDASVDTHTAYIQGGTLMCWHMMLLLRDFQAQLAAMAQGIDLQKVQLAKTLMVNLQQLEVHLMALVADEGKMTAALVEAARIAKLAKEQLDAERAGGMRQQAQPSSMPSSIIITG